MSEPGEDAASRDEDGRASEGGAGVDAPHEADGLDLARQIARSLAAAPGVRKPPSRRTPDPSSRRRKGGRVSGARPDDRDPQLLDSTVERLVSDRGWGVDLKVHAVFGRWADLVGEEIAAHSTPEAFADGRLVVRTDSTAWATQLRLLAPQVLRRLNEDLGDGTVTFVEVAGPRAPSWKHGRLSARDGRGPRDTYG